jgi:hypothetical protein
MADPIKLRLTLVDVHDNNLREKVDVTLRHQVLDQTVKVSASAGSPIDIPDLNGAPQGLYRIVVDPPSYRTVSQFVNMKASGTTPLKMVFAIDPEKVKRVVFPDFADLSADLRQLLEQSKTVLGFEGKAGPDLYGALDDIRKAGLLNIAVKTAHTPLGNGSTVLPHIAEIVELRGDRFFAVVPKALREEVKNSVNHQLFDPAPSTLHHPPAGFTPARSFKTPDNAGNLQLTFAMNGDDCRADIDIDDAAGIGHLFQVLHNALTGSPTHPYNIHEILINFQHLDPGYTFEI